MICYNLKNHKKIIEIKNFNEEYITNYRHYLDTNNKRDLIMTLYWQINNIKIWNVYNWEIILNIEKVNNYGFINSACFLKDKNRIYIITSNCNYESSSEPIKIYDFNGNKINEIINSEEKTLFVDVYYDELLSKNFIISCNFNHVKTYNFQNNKLYQKYYDNMNEGHHSATINKNDNVVQLIESCIDGNIRIWDFHSGLLLNKIKVCENYFLYGLCLWNKKFLFIGCGDNTIKLIDLEKKLAIKNLIGYNMEVLTIKKIIHPEYGECIICQGFLTEPIKVIINEKNSLYSRFNDI